MEGAVGHVHFDRKQSQYLDILNGSVFTIVHDYFYKYMGVSQVE